MRTSAIDFLFVIVISLSACQGMPTKTPVSASATAIATIAPSAAVPRMTMTNLETTVGYTVRLPSALPPDYVFESATSDQETHSVCLQYSYTGGDLYPDHILVAQGPAIATPRFELGTDTPPSRNVPIGGAENKTGAYNTNQPPRANRDWGCQAQAFNGYIYLGPDLTWRAAGMAFDIYTLSNGIERLTRLELQRIAESITGVPTHTVGETDPERLPVPEAAQALANFEIAIPYFLPKDLTFSYAVYHQPYYDGTEWVDLWLGGDNPGVELYYRDPAAPPSHKGFRIVQIVSAEPQFPDPANFPDGLVITSTLGAYPTAYECLSYSPEANPQSVADCPTRGLMVQSHAMQYLLSTANPAITQETLITIATSMDMAQIDNVQAALAPIATQKAQEIAADLVPIATQQAQETAAARAAAQTQELATAEASVGYPVQTLPLETIGFTLNQVSVYAITQSVCLHYTADENGRNETHIFLAQGPLNSAPALQPTSIWGNTEVVSETVILGGVAAPGRLLLNAQPYQDPWACTDLQSQLPEYPSLSYVLVWQTPAQRFLIYVYADIGGLDAYGLTRAAMRKLAESITGVSTQPADALDPDYLHSTADAAKLAGYTVEDPTYLPEGVSFFYATYQETPRPSVTLHFRIIHPQYGDMGRFFSITQEPQTEAPAICDEPLGQPLSSEGCEVLRIGQTPVVYHYSEKTDRLEWRADGFVFFLLRSASEPNKVYRDELVKIVESLLK